MTSLGCHPRPLVLGLALVPLIVATLRRAHPDQRRQRPPRRRQAPTRPADGSLDVEALANDEMRGRETGSPEHRKAADYVAEHFKQAGLQPAGSGGYLQPVAFRSRKIDESRSSLALVAAARPSRSRSATRRPSGCASIRRRRRGAAGVRRLRTADSRSEARRLRRSRRQGQGGRATSPAARRRCPGALQRALPVGGRALEHAEAARRDRRRSPLPNPKSHGRAVGALGARRACTPRWRWPTRRSTTPPGSRWRSPSIRRRPSKLFAGSGHTFAELLALADDGQGAAALRAAARRSAPRSRSRRSDVESQNVVGMLHGQRSRRWRNEYVVAHRRTSITSASARRSTATRSTTARWTTRRASRR